ncbi:hypothetical protein GCM10009840_05860 [Pseudolysinimonas kribbensis]|jgi:hypothetical protein|uniref:hypothetical protein n=1 Tax=Pseudolysinimonas kribbensis TaxID=433641 RepID=UPI0031DDDCB3
MSKSPSVRAGRVFDARLQLLDRQVLDPDGMPVTAVAGLELSDVPWGEDLPADAEAPVVTALLTGPVLGTRVFGGRLPSSRWIRIAWGDIREIGTAIAVARPADSYEVSWTERWVRDRIIGVIPGGRHDPE